MHGGKTAPDENGTEIAKKRGLTPTETVGRWKTYARRQNGPVRRTARRYHKNVG